MHVILCFFSMCKFAFFTLLTGVNYVYQFCVGAAKGVLSPFVLQEIIMEALQRLNPAHIHAHLRTPAFHQLVQRCQQAYLQVWHSYLHPVAEKNFHTRGQRNSSLFKFFVMMHFSHFLSWCILDSLCRFILSHEWMYIYIHKYIFISVFLDTEF